MLPAMMPAPHTLLVFLLLLCCLPAHAQQKASGPARPAKNGTGALIGKKVVPFAELPAELSDNARRALQRVRPYCEAQGLVALPDPDLRFVMLVPEINRSAQKLFQQACETADWFDERLPETANQMPAQPEGTWQDDAFTPNTEVAVLHILRNEGEQAALLSQMAEEQTDLSIWARSASQMLGFTLLRPLCAAIVMEAEGNEEWSPEHELANRLTQLLLQRRFGQQPYWLRQGIAWCAEWRLNSELYCFPYRKEFVPRAEHGAWALEAKVLFQKRASIAVSLEELHECQSGSWNGPAARKAFGVAGYLLSRNPAELSAALEALRVHRELDNRATRADGSWSRIPGYEVSGADLDRILGAQLGSEWRSAATAHVASGGKQSRRAMTGKVRTAPKGR